MYVCVCVYLQSISPLLGQSAQVVPLVTDGLAASVHSSSIMVIQLTEHTQNTHSQMSLYDAWLMLISN